MTDLERRRFLGESVPVVEPAERPSVSALVVGASDFAGALVPVLPVLGGARTALASLLTAGTLIIAVSAIVAFLAGMEIRRRVVNNLVIIAAAVAITFGIGVTASMGNLGVKDRGARATPC